MREEQDKIMERMFEIGSEKKLAKEKKKKKQMQERARDLHV